MIRLALKQGIGQQGTAIVKGGEHIRRGQVLTQIDQDHLGVPLHASVNGVVRKITGELIFIEPTNAETDYEPLPDTKELWQKVRDAGIVGMGGAGFPTYVKLKTNFQGTGYVLCNAAECEPILHHNIEQIMETPEKLIRGMQLAMEATNASHGIIGIKLKNKAAVKKLTTLLKDEPAIRVQPLKDMYPMGEERALIRETLNILLAPDELPEKANAIVINSETMMAIADAVDDSKPLIDKHITVAGKIKNIRSGEVKTMLVPIGTRVDDILKNLGGATDSAEEILVGGPYTGRQAEAEEAISKTCGAVLVTEPVDQVTRKLGLIQCACGANEKRMQEIAASMNADIVGHVICKNAVEVKPGTYKCKDPGNCPGQAEKVLALRKAGAEEVLIGHCTDCTNTVMAIAPKLKMEVHHITDAALKTQNMDVIRRMQQS